MRFLLLVFILINFGCSQKSYSQNYIREYQNGLLDYKNRIYALSFIEIEPNKRDYTKKAKEEALSDIATQLYSLVLSEANSLKEDNANGHNHSFTQNVNITSNIPIYGAMDLYKESRECLYEKSKECYYLLMMFDKRSASKIYKEKANEEAIAIDDYYKSYENSKDIDNQEKFLKLAKSSYENYEKYSVVSKLLGENNIVKPNTKSYDIDVNLITCRRKNAKNITSLANNLIYKLSKDYSNIEVFPIGYEDSDRFSTFSSELQSLLISELKNRSVKQNGKYILSGKYFLNDNDLRVDLYLYDKNGVCLDSTSAKMSIKNSKSYIPPKSEYKNMNNLLLSNKLSVMARLNGRDKNLLFKNGDKVTLDIKVSHEAYVYIVANIKDNKNNLVQYLLPFNYKDGNEKFMLHIHEQKANLWNELNSYNIQPPFGMEVLHIFASKSDISKPLPKTILKEIDGKPYYIIVDEKNRSLSANESIAKVRGLVLDLPKIKKDEIKISEFKLQFTTIE